MDEENGAGWGGHEDVEVLGSCQSLVASGLSTLNKDQIAERGARMARRDDREYREYLSEEQRSRTRGPQRGTRVGVEARSPQRGTRVGVEVQTR